MKDGPFVDILHFNKYDNYGNILEVQKGNSYKTVYLWGYNGQYPIAKIEGSDFNFINSHVDTSILNHGTQSAIDIQINGLRGVLKTYPLVKISSYKYSPLIGIQLETDPKGVELKYEYDDLGRLMDIKDNNDHTIRTFRYHFKNK